MLEQTRTIIMDLYKSYHPWIKMGKIDLFYQI